MSNVAVILECSHICKTAIFDYYRTCSKCGCDVCLVCCREIRDYYRTGPQPESGWKVDAIDDISCAYDSGNLELRTLFSGDWVSQLVNRAEGLLQGLGVVSVAPSVNKCACCNSNGDQCDQLLKASSRKESDDNYLFYPKAKNLTEEDYEHFRHHWMKGEPVIVGNVLETGTGLSWDPEVMWRAFRQIKSKKHDALYDVKTLYCLDWREEDVHLREFFNGYSKGRLDNMGWPFLLKLKDWPPSATFRERLPRHSAEYTSCLPLKDYTHPDGPLNVASKLPSYSRNSNMGTKAHISYGFPHELGRGDSVTKLHCDHSDTVNILAHTQVINYTNEMLSTIENLKEQHFEEDQRELFGINEVDSNQIGDEAETRRTDIVEGGALWDIFRREDVPKLRKYLRKHFKEGGALWDIFRRQDVSKLNEYLLKHFKEFRHIHCSPLQEVVDPIHDQTFYLTEKHKRKLKKEYGIEPWTFVQKLGDAVFIPAGCPYQVRNLKSCINVASNFVSPESIGACIRLTDEFRLLPLNHPAKEDKLQVKKMCLHAVDRALSIVMNKSQVRDDEEQGFNGKGKSGIKLEEESTET
ncbi:Lysine-specific demethylase JMJ25 [Linum perenne]